MKVLYIVLISLSIVSCQHQDKTDLKKAKQASIDSMKVEINKQKVIDSMKVEMAKLEKEKADAKAAAEAQKVVVVNHQADGTATPTTPKKKGWSSAAKGAVIGAGVGAITGAAVSKKKGEGAVIGGLAGAGVGAGTGAIIDSKKKKE